MFMTFLKTWALNMLMKLKKNRQSKKYSGTEKYPKN